MKTITELKKLKQGYKVTFDEDEPIKIEFDIYLKFHLKVGLALEEGTYQKLILENNYLYFMRLGVLRLKRMQTKKELFDYLVNKGCSFGLANQLIKHFEEKRYLNDQEYTKLYIDIKKNQQGPKMLQNNLRKKGIEQAMIDAELKNLDQIEILTKLITKKYLSYKNKTKKQALLSTKMFAITKGFKQEQVDRILTQIGEAYPKDEISILYKDADKLITRYKNKKSGIELKSFVKQKLYQKGFSLEDIELILLEKEVLS